MLILLMGFEDKEEHELQLTNTLIILDSSCANNGLIAKRFLNS